MGLLALHSVLPLWFIARPVIDLRVRHLWATLAIGAAVFVVWIAPDLLFKGYRHFWLFENAVMGKASTSFSSTDLSWPVLTLRMIRAVVIVPIIEELFWRAWLMRWIIDQDFQKIPLGKYTAQSFWIVAALFASEHGPYWDVGLAAGIVYNWWMVRARSLGDLILTHAVTNFILGVYVIAFGKWEYWL
jgi:CAAX prenyl protease-like protein